MSDQQFRAEVEAQFGAPIPTTRAVRQEHGHKAAAQLSRLRDAGDQRRNRRMRLLGLAERLLELRGEPRPEYCFINARRFEAWVASHTAVHGEGFAIEALDRAISFGDHDDADDVMALADQFLAFADGGAIG